MSESVKQGVDQTQAPEGTVLEPMVKVATADSYRDLPRKELELKKKAAGSRQEQIS